MRSEFTLSVGFIVLLTIAGCGPSKGPAAGDPATEMGSKEATKPDNKEPVSVAPNRDLAAEFAKLAKRAETEIAEKQLAKLEATLGELQKVYPTTEKPSESDALRLAEIEQNLAELRRTAGDEQRTKKLAEAQELLDLGKLTEATVAVNEVRENSPTAKQREYIRQLSGEIETRRRARRDLQAWMQMLGSANRSEVATAQAQLIKHPDTAVGMMVETSSQADQPVLVANALEMLRLLDRPNAALPAMLAVLKRTQQRKNWPDAVRELGLMEQPGAGAPLLELALASTDPEQQMAALTALSQVPDAPRNTLVSLLPLIDKDSPALAVVLQTAAHAIRVHGQYDLAARRGLDELSEEQEKLLDALPERLTKLIADGKSPEGAAVAAAANVLAMQTGQVVAPPLAGIKIARAEAESAEGPAAAVLDGVWNTVDLKNMWKYPADKRGTILLDLGETRTVAGVRIWNFNEPAGMQRGWKEVEIFVSDSPAEPAAAAQGIVPQAPGVADTPDYGTFIGVPQVRGRYVRLQAKSLWATETHSGLSEIQVLGF